MAYIAAFRSLPLGVEIFDELLEVFHGRLCFVDHVLGFFLSPLCIPALLSCQGAQVPLVSVDNELLTLSSIHGAFPHHSQVLVSRKKYQMTRLARIVVMI